MPGTYNLPLLIGGALSAVAAILHLAIIVGGAAWYRFFGAGEVMARAAEQGRRYPAVVTAAIAALLGTWSAYALSGGRFIPALPLVRPVLLAITAIYLLRGFVIVPVLVLPRTRTTAFGIWSSGICLVFGAVHALGVYQAWLRL